jgi:hypothetical protein
MKTMKVIVFSVVIAICNIGITFADEDETRGEHEYTGHTNDAPQVADNNEIHSEHEFAGRLAGLSFGIILIAALVGGGVLVAFLVAKKKKNTNIKKQEDPETVRGQILAMLTEYGGALKQDEIHKNLGLPSDLVSSMLLSLEKSGQITRDWTIENYRDTFLVKKLPKA